MSHGRLQELVHARAHRAAQLGDGERAGADGVALVRELDRGWDRFGAELPGLTVPTLAVHGSNDMIAPAGAVRAYAEQIDALRFVEFAGARHDILNEVQHRDVAAAIVGFIADHVG